MKKLIILAQCMGGTFYGKSEKESEILYQALSEEVKSSGSWWYLHGDLEDIVGYDKGLILNPEDFGPGIFEVEVEGISDPCIGYFWNAMDRLVGLVGLKKDEPSMKYIKEKYNSKSLTV
jgi:hypothetical protein